MPGARAGAVLLGLAFAAGAAGAADIPDWKLSGFGTLGLAHANRTDVDFTSSPLKGSGAGFSERWSPHVDSRLGVQLDVTQGRWSAVLQVVSEQQMDNSYRPRVEWANVKYQLTPDLALRVGRIAPTIFLAADYRKVGYIYPWVRPPVEVYGFMPVSGSDGVDLAWRWTAGPVHNLTQAFFGHADMGLSDRERLKGNAIAGIATTAEHGAASVRASLATADLTLSMNRPLFDGLSSFGPAGAALVDRYDVAHRRVVVASVGLNYDPGDWFALAEASHTRTSSYLGTTSAFYVSAGYRWGSLTPYAAYAHVQSSTPNQVAGLPLDGLSTQQAAGAAALNHGLNTLLKTIPMQSSVSLGTRWDFHPDLALKVQYDRLAPHGASRGTTFKFHPSFTPGSKLHVASVALDFVF